MSLNRMLVLAAVLVGSVLLAFSATRAANDDPTQEEIAAGIAAFKAAGLGEVFDKVLPLTSEQIQNRLLGQRPDLRKEIPEVVADVAFKLIPRRKELDTATGRLWAKSFSLEELQGITAFFRSGPGKKYLALGPGAFNVSSDEMKKWAARVADEMYDKSLAELKAKGVDF